MQTVIYLIRHAEPLRYDVHFIGNQESQQIVNEKQILSVEGEKQAYYLSNVDELQKLNLVLSSNYARAIGTAKYLVDKNSCKFIITSSLGERKLGTEKKSKNFWLEQMLNEDLKSFDGESQCDVRKRMITIINHILGEYKGKRVAVVTHAAAITFLLLNWCKLEDVLLEGKKRKISFQDKVIIDGSFTTPDVFKLVFDDNQLIAIERINIEE